MTKYDPELRDNTVSEWRLRLLLRLGRWTDAYQLTRRCPATWRPRNRWRYWQARSLELAQPNSKDPIRLYRRWPGSVTSTASLPPTGSTRPISSTTSRWSEPSVMRKVRNTAGIRRALEFHARGQIVDGRREWYHVGRLFSREEMVAQARLGYEMEWYFPAIRAISQAQYWDDLDVRFPMAHRSTLTREARKFAGCTPAGYSRSPARKAASWTTPARESAPWA